jgi:hypothetical protein
MLGSTVSIHSLSVQLDLWSSWLTRKNGSATAYLPFGLPFAGTCRAGSDSTLLGPSHTQRPFMTLHRVAQQATPIFNSGGAQRTDLSIQRDWQGAFRCSAIITRSGPGPLSLLSSLDVLSFRTPCCSVRLCVLSIPFYCSPCRDDMLYCAVHSNRWRSWATRERAQDAGQVHVCVRFPRGRTGTVLSPLQPLQHSRHRHCYYLPK